MGCDIQRYQSSSCVAERSHVYGWPNTREELIYTLTASWPVLVRAELAYSDWLPAGRKRVAQGPGYPQMLNWRVRRLKDGLYEVTLWMPNMHHHLIRQADAFMLHVQRRASAEAKADESFQKFLRVTLAVD